jgi:nicotinate phosphoribosyltransferase
MSPRGTFVSGPLALHEAGLFTDLYEITMAASYFRERINEEATFSLFVRKLPPERSFLVMAGLEDVLEFLAAFAFSEAALGYLRSLGRFEADFLDFLRGLRFTGSVRAVPEGTALFGEEPLLEVTAPIIEAQLVETAIVKAARGGAGAIGGGLREGHERGAHAPGGAPTRRPTRPPVR